MFHYTCPDYRWKRFRDNGYASKGKSEKKTRTVLYLRPYIAITRELGIRMDNL